MARIRTIKPELWTDPEFVECSPNARLLFVAALNFASDYGVLPDKPKQLKMQCFPGDAFDVEPLVDELVAAGFWQARTAPDGANVLVIRTFTQHQRVDRPNLGRWGDPATWDQPPTLFDEHSTNGHRTIADQSPPEGKGREGKGKGSSSSRANGHLRPVDNPTTRRDDDLEAVLAIITNARIEGRTGIRNPRAYRNTILTEARAQDGELARSLLADGSPLEQVALFILGHGLGAELEHNDTPTGWCEETCDECHGDQWIWMTDDDRPHACPNGPRAKATT